MRKTIKRKKGVSICAAVLMAGMLCSNPVFAQETKDIHSTSDTTIQENAFTDSVSNVVTQEMNIEKDADQSDWDPEDPMNGKILMEREQQDTILEYDTMDNEFDEDTISGKENVPVLYAASGNEVKTIWESSNGSYVTYTHNLLNTKGRQVIPGIDVSYHNGTIDWQQVKASGVQYALIRVGYRTYTNGNLKPDIKFEEYIKGAKAAGLKVGVYIYSQAISPAEAEQEAEFALNKVKNYRLDLPVTFDYEYYGADEGRLKAANLSKEQKTACARAFCEKVKRAGYIPMIYANSVWCVNELDAESLSKDYKLWMARYNTYSYNQEKDKGRFYGGRLDYWQCSSHAKVNGINDRVDFNYWYYDPTETPEGWVVYDEDNGQWEYKKYGQIDRNYTGVRRNENGWWYIKNGIVDFTANTVAQNENGWWKISNGSVDFNYKGFEQNQYGWWYLEHGKVNFNVNGLAYGTVNGKEGWWHVKENKVVFDEDVVQNYAGWWYVKNGMVDFSTNTVAHNSNGWWKISSGKVDFNYKGFEQNQYGWWYLEHGKVNFNVNGLVYGKVNGKNVWRYVKGSKVVNDEDVVQNSVGWWYVKDGTVDFSAHTVAQNHNGWWKISGGKVDFNYKGFEKNQYGWWYLEHGKVNFNINGLVYGTVDGKEGWWHVKESKVVFDEDVVQNANGWWYVNNGMVDFTANTIACNRNGWWKIQNGKVDFSYTGDYEYDGEIYEVSGGYVRK